MGKNIDEKELLVLEIIRDSNEPVGSWVIADKLSEKGYSVSSATVGRILNKLEKMGYLEKEKFRGRVITKKGEEAIKTTNVINKIEFHKKKLEKYINTKVLEDFLVILEARKSIERTTARLAAENITQEEIAELERILETQENNYRMHKSISQNDLDFHKAIARASRNKVLETLYHIISLSGQQSEIFEYLREKVGAPYMVSHRKILEALKKGDPDESEKSMIEHIENLIKDVRTYWKTFNEK
ncbi:MAG: GntR family transcriptional regulator, transcriptional repressor for pyruvate dehydrogenase complex [Thermosediminibacterales bacterium]|nr:GntR family transcriptional regulator, transcriptional repressor for pyruvate dehydrogenase complex [Thermosediminibacterales bacterium]